MYFFRTSVFILILLAFFSSTGNSQDLGSWNVYSSFSTINDISVSDGGDIYNATLGGLFIVSQANETNTLTTIDGMHRLDPVKSAFDNVNSNLILGYTDGTIDLLDISSQTFSKIEDIARVDQFSSKNINAFEIKGRELFVATDFGLVVFDLDDFFVKSSYLKIGGFERGIQVRDIHTSTDSIYVATQEGVAIASLSDNLLEESSWTTYNTDDGLETSIIEHIAVIENEVYAYSGTSLYELNNGTWSITNEFGTGTLLSLEISEDNILVATYPDRIVTKTALGVIDVTGINSNRTARSSILLNRILNVGTSVSGLLRIDIEESTEEQFLTDGPYLNFFSNMEYEENVLVSTSTVKFPSFDPFNSIRGYYIFENNSWSSYNIRTSEELGSANFSTAYSLTGSNDHYYIGSWGRGVARHNKETNEIDVSNAENSGFTGINSGQSSFVVISGLDTDSRNNTWAISYDSNKPLNVQTSGSDEWVHLNKEAITLDNLYFNLFIDSNDQKWISLIDFNGNGKGLLVLDTGEIEDETDDVFRKLTLGSNNGNLPDEFITAIVEDKNGEVWIGTERGLARFIFPEFIARSTNPNEYQAQWLINEDTSATSRFLLRDINVSTIAVNEANEKWIGSVNQGVWILNEDGSRIEQRFTKDNSPLISDNIISITINDETGEVFISTDLGLVSFNDISIKPVNKMDELKVYPNPFSYSQNDQVIVEGLSEATMVKVLGVDGTVVQELSTRGGRVTWNGLDYLGNKLGTGVYFVVALEVDGKEKGIGKVVIIN